MVLRELGVGAVLCVLAHLLAVAFACVALFGGAQFAVWCLLVRAALIVPPRTDLGFHHAVFAQLHLLHLHLIGADEVGHLGNRGLFTIRKPIIHTQPIALGLLELAATDRAIHPALPLFRRSAGLGQALRLGC